MLESQRAVEKIVDKLNEQEVQYLKNIFDKFGDDTL